MFVFLSLLSEWHSLLFNQLTLGQSFSLLPRLLVSVDSNVLNGIYLSVLRPNLGLRVTCLRCGCGLIIDRDIWSELHPSHSAYLEAVAFLPASHFTTAADNVQHSIWKHVGDIIIMQTRSIIQIT